MPSLITNKNLGFTKQKCNCGIISNSIGGFQGTIYSNKKHKSNKSNKNNFVKNKSNKNKYKKTKSRK